MATHTEDRIDELESRISNQFNHLQKGGQITASSYSRTFEDISDIICDIMERERDDDMPRLVTHLRQSIDEGIEIEK